MDETAFDTSNANFDKLEDVVMSTPRGRWFLKEFAKRNRVTDTEAVLDRLMTLETAAPELDGDDRIAAMHEELRAMAQLLPQGRAEIEALPFGDGELGRLSLLAEEHSEDVMATLLLLEQRVAAMIDVWCDADAACEVADEAGPEKITPEADDANQTVEDTAVRFELPFEPDMATFEPPAGVHGAADFPVTFDVVAETDDSEEIEELQEKQEESGFLARQRAAAPIEGEFDTVKPRGDVKPGSGKLFG